jgi:hypothetical protein
VPFAVGGIYTVIKTKANETVRELGSNYWCKKQKQQSNKHNNNNLPFFFFFFSFLKHGRPVHGKDGQAGV